VPARVLIIDDSESVRTKVKETLQKGGVGDTFIEAADGTEGLKKLLEQPHPDLVLCDLIMPGMDGFKFLAAKKQRKELEEIPVLLLSGEEDIHEKVRGLEAGASDYITKPFHEQELVARAKVHLKLKQLQDRLKVQNEMLAQQSRTDQLTGVASRGHFMETFRRELQRARRYSHTLAYVMVDIDHFKKINDEHGHQTGDAVLTAVATALQKELRETDLVGRYGGEEFGLLLVQADAAGAKIVAERCRKNIEKLKVPPVKQVTISLGIVSYPQHDAEAIDALIKLADAALYEAKRAGRNRVTSA
jgi:two-component system, cell cycle response regulator